MKAKWFVAVAVILTVCVVAGLLKSREPRQVAAAKPQEKPVIAPVEAPPAPVEEKVVPEPEVVAPAVVQPEPAPKKVTQGQPQAQPQKPAKEPLQDPDARDALALVGTDPDAEQYWLTAIYDTNLPDKEREDLMEDLNEVGFADPKNLTAEDLPLIVNRIHIIEDILPQADPFMTKHLLEAYKDLGHMYAGASGQ